MCMKWNAGLRVVLGLLFAALLAFSITACGSDDEATDGDVTDGDLTDGDAEDGDAEAGDTEDGDTEDGDTDGDIPGDELPFAPAGLEAAPEPSQFGPFPVGVKTITLYDESRIDDKTNSPRRLKTEIWYPAKQAFKDGPFYVMDLATESIGEELGDAREAVENAGIEPVTTASIRDAEIDVGNGPFPIILFSHGANGIRFQSLFYTIHLASHGYIVAAVDHQNNTLWDILRDGYNEASVIASAPDRPKDMTFLLDNLLAFNDDEENFFYGSMDPENVGITGHSFGGFTSVATPCTDSRIKVSIPHAPVISFAALFGCTLERYPVPMMMMGGNRDRTLNWKDMYCEYNMVQGNDKFMYELENGGHYTFSNMCQLDLVSLADKIDFGDAEDALNDGCSEADNADWREAHVTINHYATAMFNGYLRHSPASMDYMVERDDPPFDVVHYHVGDVPDWPDGGCGLK